MHRILVIGGTGNVGRHVVDQLAATGARFRAMARNPDAASLPSQVEVVRGDLTVPESLDRCLQDIDTVFLVWVAPPAAVAGALERIAKDARRIVFLTAPLKTPHPWAAAIGQPAVVTSTFAELTGTPPRTFLEWAADYAADFREVTASS